MTDRLFRIMSQLIDLSLRIETGMPYFPGDPQPSVEQFKRVEIDGYSLKRLVLGTHTGTHIDAPSHFIAGAETIDRLDPLAACGRAKVIDASGAGTKKLDNFQIPASSTEKILLIYTGTNRLLKTGFGSEDIVTLGVETARQISQAGYKAVGIDSPSVGDSLVHRTILGSNTIIIENLSSELGKLVGRSVEFLCLPLKVADGDGAPARAVALL
jgi:arylformamidase